MRQLTSTLDKIATQVFESKSIEEAKDICLNFLKESKIKESDRLKMISEITSMKHLYKIQYYIANALLKFEGLSVGTKTPNSTDKPNPES